jgi:surface antigen
MIAALRHSKRLVSFRAETSIILGVIIVLLILPSAVVASVSNIGDLLENGVSAGDSGGNGVFYTGSSPSDNTYAWGNCTYWVFIQRLNAGNPIPNTWGNAATWAYYAELQGYVVDQTPAVGAIMQTANSAKGLGHVAYVIAVDPATGAWTISEMNSKGLNVVSERTLTAANALDYNFIHGKEQ